MGQAPCPGCGRRANSCNTPGAVAINDHEAYYHMICISFTRDKRACANPPERHNRPCQGPCCVGKVDLHRIACAEVRACGCLKPFITKNYYQASTGYQAHLVQKCAVREHPQVDLRSSCMSGDAQAAAVHAGKPVISWLVPVQDRTVNDSISVQTYQHQEVASVAEVQEVVMRPVTQSTSIQQRIRV